jgi:hypothetical protein
MNAPATQRRRIAYLLPPRVAIAPLISNGTTWLTVRHAQL